GPDRRRTPCLPGARCRRLTAGRKQGDRDPPPRARRRRDRHHRDGAVRMAAYRRGCALAPHHRPGPLGGRYAVGRSAFAGRRDERMNPGAWRHSVRRGMIGAALALALTLPSASRTALAKGADAVSPAPSVGDTACRIVDSAARATGVPVDLLTRL